jgi:hypothetical protein
VDLNSEEWIYCGSDNEFSGSGWDENDQVDLGDRSKKESAGVAGVTEAFKQNLRLEEVGQNDLFSYLIDSKKKFFCSKKILGEVIDHLFEESRNCRMMKLPPG